MVSLHLCILHQKFNFLQEEWAREEFYFQQLEIKEAMQEKMQKIEKLSVKVVTCKEVSLLSLGGKCVTLYP